MPDIFLYSDYRKFLHDWFGEKKQANGAVSLRMIARQVGYRSASYLSMVITGSINMSPAMCLRFASFMKLSKKKADYFQTMLLFGNATTDEERTHHFDRMRSFKEAVVHIVEASHSRYYLKWYNAALRALLEFTPLRDNFEEIGRMFIPELSANEVREAFELLNSLQMIVMDHDGFYRLTDAVVSSGYDASGAAIKTFLHNSLKLAQAALDRFPQSERNISSLTLGISEQGFAEIRQELREFRRKILKIAEDDKAARVYQLSFQLFPLSRHQPPDVQK